MDWLATDNGWVIDASDTNRTGLMPRGERIIDLVPFQGHPPHTDETKGLVKHRDADNDITKWTYRYPDGKVATILND
jgi:hypothetical protein